MAPQSVLAVALLASLAQYSYGCIYLYGDAKDSLAAPSTPHWNHGFLGDDWDDSAWSCKSGTRQSPINIAATSATDHAWDTTGADVGGMPSHLRTRWSYPALESNGSNVQVINNGHTIQVQWYHNYPAQVTIAAPANPDNTTTVTAVLDMAEDDDYTRVSIKPLQFHFHSHSEHMVKGIHYPLELHIVHSVTDPKLPGCANGCFSVTGMLFEVDDNAADNAALETIWEYMPMREGDTVYLPANETIPLHRLMPTSSLRDYVTYSGSLTTPPCSEGLLWHVLTQPQKISLAQWRKYLTAVGSKECEEAPAPSTPSTPSSPASHRRLLAATEAQSALSSSKSERITYDPVTRRVMAESDDGTYTCKVAAYGANYRMPQPINERKIRLASACSDM